MDALVVEYPQKVLPVSAEAETPVIHYQILATTLKQTKRRPSDLVPDLHLALIFQ